MTIPAKLNTYLKIFNRFGNQNTISMFNQFLVFCAACPDSTSKAQQLSIIF